MSESMLVGRWYIGRGSATLTKWPDGKWLVMWLPDGETTGSDVPVGADDPWGDFERTMDLGSAEWEAMGSGGFAGPTP